MIGGCEDWCTVAVKIDWSSLLHLMRGQGVDGNCEEAPTGFSGDSDVGQIAF